MTGRDVVERVPRTDTDLLRLLLESLRRWQPAERDESPGPSPTPHREG